MTNSALWSTGRRGTPQSAPLLGSAQVKNEAGGYVYEIDRWTALQRFLVLGTEGGTYYTGEAELTQQNIRKSMECLREDGERFITTLSSVSSSGRAKSNDQALYLLAMAMGKQVPPEIKRRAREILPDIARTGTHILHFAHFASNQRGWGRGLRTAIGSWFLRQSPSHLAFEAIKYPSRDGWALRDLLRMAHPKTEDPAMQEVLHYIVKGWDEIGPMPPDKPHLRQIWQMERIRREKDKISDKLLQDLIQDDRMPRESLPTELLGRRAAWIGLLFDMGLTALVRNLGNLSKNEVFTGKNGDSYRKMVVDRLTNPVDVERSKIHPLQILLADRTYQTGHSQRGSGQWVTDLAIQEALGEAFALSFHNLAPTGKQYLVGVDVSGSMRDSVAVGVDNLSAAEAAGLQALMLVKAEKTGDVRCVGFDTQTYELPMLPSWNLDYTVKEIKRMIHGGTDCSQPILYATAKKLPVDCFVILTDSQTWQGQIHPEVALETYNQAMGRQAKMVVVAMCSNERSLADHQHPGMLNVVGFDTYCPQLIQEFASGRIG